MFSYTTQFTQQLGSSNEVINFILEYGEDLNGDGYNDLKVTLSLASTSNSGTEDMIGVAFDVADDAVSGLQIVDIQRFTNYPSLSIYNPTVVIGANQISDNNGFLDPGFSTSGGGSDAPYDIGIKFSNLGSAEGIVQTASFVITKAGVNLDQTLLENTDWWVRLQSTDGGEDSAKMGGFIGDISSEVGVNPSIDVEKYVSIDGGQTFVDADTVTGAYLLASGAAPMFKFVVTNTGEVALSSITLSDNVYDLNGDAPGTSIVIDSLGVGGIYEYTLTAPWEAGQHANAASVSTTYNGTLVSDIDEAHYFGANPSIDVEKYVSIDGGQTFVDADIVSGAYLLESGAAPVFKFVVTNTGNVALSNINLSDNVFDLNGAAAGTNITIASLAAGATYETTFTAPWQAGQHTNTATVGASYSDGALNVANLTDSDDANYFGANPSIDVEKLVSIDGGQTFVDADTVSGAYLLESGAAPMFKFVVTNTGNVALSNINLSDSVFDLNGAAPGTNITIASLAAGGTYETTFTAPWQAGQHTNTGTVEASYSDGALNVANLSDSDDANYFGANPSIDVEKLVSIDGGQTFVDADTVTGPYLVQGGGEPIFKFLVTNTGNVALSNINLSDNVFDLNGAEAGTNITIASLGAGATYETTFTAPWQAGQQTSTGTVGASYTDGALNVANLSDSDDANYFGDALPNLQVIKTAEPAIIREDLGGSVTYTITIINTSPISGDYDPVTLSSMPDSIWTDGNGNGIQDSGEVLTVDRLSDALADWVAQGNTGPIVLQPRGSNASGSTFTFDYTVSYSGGNVLKPWADPLNTIVVNGTDNEGNLASGSDDVVVDVYQKNQRSIEIDSLTGTRQGTVLSGNFRIENASGDPVDVLVDSINVGYEESMGGKKKTWLPTDNNYTTQFWLDSNPNGVLDANETLLGTSKNADFLDASIVFGSQVYIGYQSTFDGSVPDPIRATAQATIDGRFDRFNDQVIFHYSQTF